MNWQTPQELPDLRSAGIVSIDTEATMRGCAPSWSGLAVARRPRLRRHRRLHADGGIRSHHFPLRHPDTNNFDPRAGLSAG